MGSTEAPSTRRRLTRRRPEPAPPADDQEPSLRSAAAAFGWKKLALLFMLVFVVHSVGPSVQVTDSRLSVFTAYSVYRHGTLDLSRLPPQARSQIGTDDYDVVNHDGALLPFYPYGPMVMLTQRSPPLAGFDPAGLRLIGPNETWKIEVPSASLLVALSTVAMALIGYALTRGPERLRVRVGLTTALFFGFGTAAWSTASRSFGQHTPAMFFIALALMVLIAGARTSRRSLVPAGACLAAAYVMRPTSAITVAVLGVWILLTQRNRLVGWSGVRRPSSSPSLR